MSNRVNALGIRAAMGLLAAAAAALFCGAGCGSGPGRAAPVDPPQAREALRTALDAWRNGEPIRSLQERSPEIVVQDVDWEAGWTLVEYRIVGEGTYDDANLLCPVELVLQDAEGNEVRRTVTYVVGTDPVLTVFRDMFR